MNRPEPIELENNLGPDAVTGEINRVPWMAYDVDEMDIYIAELNKKLMPCLNGDCILTCEVVEKYGKEKIRELAVLFAIFIGALFLTVAILAALVLVVVGLIYCVGGVA